MSCRHLFLYILTLSDFPTKSAVGRWGWRGFRLMFLVVLLPCSLLYRGIVSMRFRGYRLGLFKQVTLPCPVISIGNMTTGGTGKTPMAIAVADLLRAQGKRVAILTRGYYRKQATTESNNAIWAVDMQANAARVGDEPLLMWRQLNRHLSADRPEVAVMVGRQRYLAGNAAIERYQSDIFVLDDGFQHLQLARTCDLVLIDATQPFGGGHVLPAGLLREPLNQLERANAFVITRSNEVAHLEPIHRTLRRWNAKAPIFYGQHEFEMLRRAETGERVEIESLQDAGILAISGLGNPASFHRLLRQIGLPYAASLDFPDHHWYTEQDIERLRNLIRAEGLEAIVTTEKDETRLLSYCDALTVPLYVVTIRMSISPEAAFRDYLLSMIE